jgi:hypothetical protein
MSDLVKKRLVDKVLLLYHDIENLFSEPQCGIV